MDPRTPILVGCGQITDTTSQASSERSLVAFVAEAAKAALEDTRAALTHKETHWAGPRKGSRGPLPTGTRLCAGISWI